jgi:methionyl-tRNA synthetase
VKEPILVTSGLPYANGSIHIGHMVEVVMTDTFVRGLRLAGEDALYVCADDTHGTPIEINAKKAGVAPEDFVARFAKEHLEDFHAFGIHFDSYHSTNSLENRRWVTEIYTKLKSGGHLTRKTIEQLYDETAGRFLPDRFVKGTCPKCKSPDQYGDVCEVCSSTYEPTDLIDPYSVETGTRPVLKQSEHLYVELSHFATFLGDWSAEKGRLQPDIKKFVDAWLEGGLKDWCISRDAPYFGFAIPDEPNKFFYVWLDAPVGYVSSTENWGRLTNREADVDRIWRQRVGKIIHVIGKDIVYFHALFWPAVLYAAGLSVPTQIRVHGMLTVDGVKMSKSKGTFINASTFRKFVDPIYLRYYFAAKAGPGVDDIDLSLEELVNRVNAELVNNFANLVSRSASFLGTKLDGRYGKLPADAEQHVAFVKAKVAEAEAAYRAFDLAAAIRAALDVSSLGNKLFQDNAPWTMLKTDPVAAKDLVTLCLNIARAATVLIAPAVPTFAEKVYPIFGLEGVPQHFSEATRFDLLDRPAGKMERIVDRIAIADLQKIVEASKPADAPAEPAASAAKIEKKKEPPKDEPLPPIAIEDFLKLDLRVGLIKTAEIVEGSDKLVKLTVDLAEGRIRTIIAGIKEAYAPAQLVERKVVVIANLKPREMKVKGKIVGTSEGMIMAAGPGGKEIWLLSVADEAPVGSKIK